MLSLLGGIFLGWALGANDASNAFGSAVASRMLRFWTAAVLASVFVLLGALLEGEAGIETLQGLTRLNLDKAVIASIAAAVTVTLMTFIGLPVSTSQATVGAILGIGFLNRHLDLGGLGKVVACWFGTPIGGLIAAIITYRLLALIYNTLRIDLFRADIYLRISLILAGSYAAYTLGANNVANVTAVFVGAGRLTLFSATLIAEVLPRKDLPLVISIRTGNLISLPPAAARIMWQMSPPFSWAPGNWTCFRRHSSAV